MTDTDPPAALRSDELGVSYADALDELEEILTNLESAAVDVDVLADRVARGAELVRFCRDRLRSVRVEVDRVVDDLLGDGGPVGGGLGGGTAGE